MYAKLVDRIPDRRVVSGFRPTLTLICVVQTLRDACGVETVCCQGEADDIIVSLFAARAPYCFAVVGDDSDYYCFAEDVRCIPFKALAQRASAGKKSSRSLSAVSTSALAEYWGVPRWLLPVIACFVGNDSTTAGQLWRFTSCARDQVAQATDQSNGALPKIDLVVW